MSRLSSQSSVIGSFVIDITPTTPVHLAGFKHRTAAAVSVHDRLEANGVVFSTGARDRAIALVTLDVLECGDLVNKLESELRSRSVDMDLMLAASHTHCGPGLSDRLAGIGPTDHTYLEWLTEALATRLQEIVERPSPEWETCNCAATTTTHSYAVNRRRWGVQLRRNPFRVSVGSQRRPNRRGATHSRLSAIAIRSPHGDPVAIIWIAHCHPTTAPWIDQVSGDFPSEVRRQLRLRVGEGETPVLFLQGGGANVRGSVTAPTSRRSLVWKELLHSLGVGSTFVEPSSAAWTHWVTKISERVEVPEQCATPVDASFRSLTLDVPGLRYADGTCPTFAMAALRISTDVILLGSNVELMAEHVEMLQTQRTSVLAFGYLGRTICYWPTTEMLREGGYEVDESLSYFGLTGAHVSDPDQALLAHARKVLAAIDPTHGTVSN